MKINNQVLCHLNGGDCLENGGAARNGNTAGTTINSLADELIYGISSFLDIESLLEMRLVNKQYRELASHNDAGWNRLTQALWNQKVIYNEELYLRALIANYNIRNASMMEKYMASVSDANTRPYMLPHDLCYDLELQSGPIWSCRLKVDAGSEYISWDPWYSGDKSRQFVFLPNGTLKQYVPPDRIQDEMVLLLPPSETIPPIPLRDGAMLFDSAPALAFTWRVCPEPLDLPASPTLLKAVESQNYYKKEHEDVDDKKMNDSENGEQQYRNDTNSDDKMFYLRLSVGGREVPTYRCHRSPTRNWGFVLENCWGMFFNFRMPIKSETESIFHDENDFAILNTTVQWREVSLYNLGAITLPEGPTAMEEFQRLTNAAQVRMEQLERQDQGDEESSSDQGDDNIKEGLLDGEEGLERLDLTEEDEQELRRLELLEEEEALREIEENGAFDEGSDDDDIDDHEADGQKLSAEGETHHHSYC